MDQNLPRLPYGIADYTTIRKDHLRYIDRTRTIADLESMGRFLFFLRPRRFGKSLLVNQLGCYYDILFKDHFYDWFSGTYIGDNPTTLANSFLVLTLNFATVNPNPDEVENSFNFIVDLAIESFLRKHDGLFDQQAQGRVKTLEKAGDKLSLLFKYIAETDLKLCLLIDEYDNFTNTILSMKERGKATYEQITHGTGFYRHFFNVLKGATSSQNSSLARLFITGVSPVTMDDVTSGFNIGKQVSRSKKLHVATGFTRDEVQNLLDQHGICDIVGLSSKQLTDILQEHYGGYQFSDDRKETIFNPDMVLYFMDNVMSEEEIPEVMIDPNVRVDYGKLHHLVATDQRLNGNFSRIQQVLSRGFLLSSVENSFPLEELVREKNFISLLYYFGLVTQDGKVEGVPKLIIPNKTIAHMMYGYMRNAMERTGVLRLSEFSLATHLRKMAYRGEWRPFFEYLAEQIQKQTSVRDFMEGEKVIQAFLLAWSGLVDFFDIHSERELNKGFCDLFFEPWLAKYPDAKFGYLLELKYIKRGEFSDQTLQKKVDLLINEAREQLAKYRQDQRLEKLGSNITWICPILVFHGWELVALESYQP